MSEKEIINLLYNALSEISMLRDEFEYTDEWQEAAAFCKSEDIARAVLKKVTHLLSDILD